MNNSAHSKALDRILGDFDGFESNRMFGDEDKKKNGMDIVITIGKAHSEPDGDKEEGMGKMPEGNEMAYSKGGIIPEQGQEPENPEVDDRETELPLFLRKKKKA